jgi:Leucine-rich repeat (LRR) protein
LAFIDQKQSLLQKSIIRKEHIIQKITEQTSENVRILLMELETGGNIRFEEEQKVSQWVTHCEKQIKKFIKRAASKDSPKTIQIHRISRIHNRGAKVKFDEKIAKSNGADTCEYLCFQNPNDGPDVFEVSEYGFEVSFPIEKFSEGIHMTNYFECQANSKECKLYKTIILRLSTTKMKELSEFDDPNIVSAASWDALVQKCDTGSDNIRSEEAKNYYILNRNCTYPEYLVEYSLEDEMDQKTNQLEKLIIDIAFSNRISHANMPTIVYELSSKIKNVYKEYDHPITLDKLKKEYPDLLLPLDENLHSEYIKYIEMKTTKIEKMVLSGSSSIPPNFFGFTTSLRFLTLTHSNLATFPMIETSHHLEYLDVSFNKIISISNINFGFPLLKTLILANNSISDMSGLRSLSDLLYLVELDLRFNDITERKGYRRFLVNNSPYLKKLDDKVISDLETEKYEYNSDWESYFQKHISDQKQSFRPFSIRTEYGLGSSSLERYYYRIPDIIQSKIESSQITTLELDGCQLVNLDRLPERHPLN